MVLAVIPALIPDIERVYDIYFEAFDKDEMGRMIVDILFPSGITPEFKKAHAEATKAFWQTSNTQFTFKCIDSDNFETIGMGMGDLVLLPEEKRVNPGVSWLQGKEKERAEKILNPLWEARDELIGDHPHIYVHVIAVDPKHQGRKAGALLCQYGIEQQERLGLPLYFESSPSTFGLYKKMGFELLDRKVVHAAADLGTEEDVTVPLMIRMPKAAKGMKFEEWQAAGYPKFEVEDASTAWLTAAVGGQELLDLLDKLIKACGGEKNLMSLAKMATAIGPDNLPQLLGLLGLAPPPPKPKEEEEEEKKTNGEVKAEVKEGAKEETVEVTQPQA